MKICSIGQFSTLIGIIFLVSCRRLSKGVESLVEASAAEAEAISATLAALKARQVNGDMSQLPNQDNGPEATPSGKPVTSMVKVSDPSAANNTPPTGVRLHHRAVSIIIWEWK